MIYYLLDARHISRDESEVQKYLQDPLNHKWVSLKSADFILFAGNALHTNADRFNVPRLLVTHGDDDKITSFTASEQFVGKSSSSDKTFISFKGSYHEPHHDLDRALVVDNLVKWLSKV